MKNVLTFLFATLITVPLCAQLTRMQIEGNPLLLNETFPERRDINGKLCAMIQVVSDMEGFKYDSYNGIVGSVIDKSGKDQIYLSPDERVLMIFHPGHEPLKFILSEIGIRLKEKQMWVIKVKGGGISLMPVSFVITPVDAEIYINGKAMGSGPTFQLDEGNYKIKIEKDGYMSVQDNIIVNTTQVLFNYRLIIKPEMVLVEGGTFEMGDTFGDGVSDEKPVHKVTLNSFEIGKTEVTQSQWIAVMGKNPAYDRGGDMPIMNVSWYDAVEFCNRLSTLSDFSPCYKIDKINKDMSNTNWYDRLKWIVDCDFASNGYRLPTEAEWEYAARGGKKSNNYKYCGSNSLDEVAWYRDNSEKVIHFVAQKKPNELGIYDILGNVNEFCWDWYHINYYKMSPENNPRGPLRFFKRIIRGGSYISYRDIIDVTNRECTDQHEHFSKTGFRLCRTIVPEEENDK